MPEGDTIRRLADRINKRFAGERVRQCFPRHPRIVHLDLVGSRLESADAVGKHLLVRFDETTLHAHLQMDGRWRLGRRTTEPAWRRRLELQMDTGWLTAIDMPVLEAVPTSAEPSIIGYLGPDLCGPSEPDLDAVETRILRQPELPLAGALLDQRSVAGFGNVYAVEVPFICGVSPFQAVASIEGLDQLLRVGAALIRTNATRGPRNTTGRRLDTSQHWVYGGRGQPCPICATTLRGLSETISPWGRVTTWCPTCQPDTEVARVDQDRWRRLLALHPAARSLSRSTP